MTTSAELAQRLLRRLKLIPLMHSSFSLVLEREKESTPCATHQPPAPHTNHLCHTPQGPLTTLTQTPTPELSPGRHDLTAGAHAEAVHPALMLR